MPPLATLPAEVVEQVAEFLDARSLAALRSTCTWLRSTLEFTAHPVKQLQERARYALSEMLRLAHALPASEQPAAVAMGGSARPHLYCYDEFNKPHPDDDEEDEDDAGAGAGGTGLHWTLQEEWEHPDPSLTVRMFALSAAPHAFIQATVDDASSTDWTAVTFEVFVYIPGQHDMRHHWRTTHCIKVFIDKQQPRTQMPSICVGVQQQSLGFNDPNFWLVSRLMDKIMFDWVLSLHTTTRGAMSIYLSSRYFQSLGESDMVVWDPLNPASAGALWMRPGIRAYCHYPMAHTLPRHLPDPLVPPDATLFL